MQSQAADFVTVASRPHMAPVARSVRKLPAVTAKRLQAFHHTCAGITRADYSNRPFGAELPTGATDLHLPLTQCLGAGVTE
jgi:hypothetical protein